MGLPLRRAVAAFFLLLIAAAAQPALAEDDPYSVTVSVDATSDTIGKARDIARNDGERRALTTLVERMSGANAAAKLQKVDDKALADLVVSFEVANERMSAVHYIADVTYHFRPTEVQRVLQKAGITIAGGSGPEPGKLEPAKLELGRSAVLLPVYQSGAMAVLWDDPNPWRDAWTQQPAGSGPARLRVPLGDAGDLAAIDAAKARAGDATALAKIAQQNAADEVIVALAAPRAMLGGATGNPPASAGLDITVRRYHAGQAVDDHSDSVTANPGERPEDVFRRAAGVIAVDIESGWKKAGVPRYDQQGSLTAVLPITGLEDWVRVRERLSALPAIRNINLVSLSVQEAMIEINYLGSVDQLKASLAEAKLDLIRGDTQGASQGAPQGTPQGASLQGPPVWRLARSGASAAH